MKFNRIILLVLACAMLMLTVSANAGIGKRIATAGATELLIPVGARGTALGGANLSAVTGIDAMYWNPAGVVNSTQRAEAMFSHLEWIGDVKVDYLAASATVGSFGAFGLNIKTLNFGDITETTVDNPDGTGRTFSPNYLTVGLNFSRKMTDRIHFGVNMKIISEKIMSVSASGLGFDLGLQYVNPATGIRLGVVLTNFGGNMKFGGSGVETRVQLPGTESGSTISSVAIPVAAFDLPSQLKFGVSYDVKVAERSTVTVLGSFVNNSYAFDQYTAGVEYNLNDMVFVRGAYGAAFREGLDNANDAFTVSSQDYLFGPSFGGGFKLGLGSGMSMMIDYAYRTAEFFSDNQWFSLTFGF